MRAIFNISAVAVFLVVAPSPCFALWLIAPVSKERAKELGMQVRTTATGPNHVIVELEFKTEGTFKDFIRVDLRVGEGDNPPVTAALREDRSKPGRVVVSFTAERGHLDKIKLWVMVPGLDGGSIYDLRVKDFVELKRKTVDMPPNRRFSRRWPHSGPRDITGSSRAAAAELCRSALNSRRPQELAEFDRLAATPSKPSGGLVGAGA
jgi:hypothetical protein